MQLEFRNTANHQLPKAGVIAYFSIHIKLLKLTEHDPYWLCNILLSNYNFQP